MRKSVCVIGGGLAGGIVASSLAADGHTVTLVELGDVPMPLIPGDEIWEGLEVKAPFTRGSGIGGTSNFWHGGLTMLDKTDVEGLFDVDARARLPIPFSRLRDYYADAIELLRNGSSYSLGNIEKRLEPPVCGFPTTRDSFGLKALLYPKRPFSTRPLIERAKERHGLRVISNTEVKWLLCSQTGRISCAVGLDRNTGTQEKFVADSYVLSAGGLGSPRILLQSIPTCAPLEKLPIGKFVIDHPTGFVFKAKLRRRMNLKLLFGEPRSGFILRYGFVLKAEHLDRADFRNHILYLRPAISMKDPGVYDHLKRKLAAYRGRMPGPRDVFQLLRHPDLLYDVVNFRYGLSHSTRFVSGLVFAEQFPREEHRMWLHDSGNLAIHWDISEGDSRSLEKFLTLFLDEYSELFEGVRVFSDMSVRLDSSGHHSGACRMAAEPGEGVVDSNLRVFGTSNLFVVDGSVLPYAGHANTGLTIAALALKCRDAVSDG